MGDTNKAEPGDYRCESHPLDCPGQIAGDWIALQSRADCSYFQSWGWIGSWLEQFTGDLQPTVVKIRSAERLVGMGVFVPGTLVRRRFIRSRAAFLNEYPFDGKNMVIEYNGVLSEQGCEGPVYSELIRFLEEEWQAIGAVPFGSIGEQHRPAVRVNMESDLSRQICLQRHVSFQVDLGAFEEGIDGYLKSLGKNRRGQIRRALRLYEEQGELKLESAKSADEALVFLDELKTLHNRSWQARGKKGSFANPLWEKFHRDLVQKRFEHGEIQLLRLSSDSSSIGYLFNYIWRERVYVLQSGFRFSADRRLTPGYVVHALAIVYNKERGMSVYDFMHGDSLYKRMLSTQSTKMYWIALQRHSLKFRLENGVVGLVRKLRGASD